VRVQAEGEEKVSGGFENTDPPAFLLRKFQVRVEDGFLDLRFEGVRPQVYAIEIKPLP
jgi:hypothetical protein